MVDQNPHIVANILNLLAHYTQPAFKPTELHVMVAQDAAVAIKRILLDTNVASQLHVIRVESGRNGSIADFITAKVRELTADPDRCGNSASGD